MSPCGCWIVDWGLPFDIMVGVNMLRAGHVGMRTSFGVDSDLDIKVDDVMRLRFLGSLRRVVMCYVLDCAVGTVDVARSRSSFKLKRQKLGYLPVSKVIREVVDNREAKYKRL